MVMPPIPSAPYHLLDAPAPTVDLRDIGDLELLTRYAAADDRAAMDELLRRHADAAQRVARRMTRSEADADDCVQQAFINCCRGAEQYGGAGSVRSWILAAVANACRMRYREEVARAERQRVAGAETARVMQNQQVEHDELDAEMAALVRELVDELPDRYRLPLWLRFFEGLDFEEVATVLAKPENTVRSQVNRAVGQLRELLRRRGHVVSTIVLLGLLGSGRLEAASTAGGALSLPSGDASATAALGGHGLGALTGGSLLIGMLVAVALAWQPLLTADAGAPQSGKTVNAVPLEVLPDEGTQQAAGALVWRWPDHADSLSMITTETVEQDGIKTARKLGSGDADGAVFTIADREYPGFRMVSPATGNLAALIKTAFPQQQLRVSCWLQLADSPADAELDDVVALLALARQGAVPEREQLTFHADAATAMLAGEWVRCEVDLQRHADGWVDLTYRLNGQVYQSFRLHSSSETLLPMSVGAGASLSVAALDIRSL